MSNIKKILYQTDLAKIFGITVKTFRKNRDIIINNNPNNPRIQRYLGKRWFLASDDLEEFLSLFSKRNKSNNRFNQSDQSALEEERLKKEHIEEKHFFDAQLELEAEYAGERWLELQSEIARGK